MENKDWPALFRSADAAAVAEQVSHFKLLKFDLLLLVVASIAGALTVKIGSVDCATIFGLIVLITSVVVALVNKSSRHDASWFACRALAESIKTETWRFAMGVGTYSAKCSGAKDAFVKRMREIVDAVPNAQFGIAGLPAEGEQITAEMQRIRALNLSERHAKYLNDRLKDQRKWYSKKAIYNRKMHACFYAASIGTLLVASVLAAVAMTGLISAGVIGVATTMSAGFTAWSSAKEYQTLASSYTMIAHELGLIDAAVSTISDEECLAALVEEVERTISREHVLWLARRGESVCLSGLDNSGERKCDAR